MNTAGTGDLGIGDAFHAAHDRVDEYNAHADVQAGVVVSFEETGEGYADPFHLANNISNGGDDQADDRQDTC